MIILCSSIVSAATGKINATDVKFRRLASTSSEIIDLLGKGTAMTIVGTQGDWFKVKIDNVNGYVFSDYVTVVKDMPAPAAEVSTVSVIVATPAGLDLSSVPPTKEVGAPAADIVSTAGIVAATVLTAPSPVVKPVAKTVIVSANTLNIREKAGSGSRKLGALSHGNAVILLEKAGTWTKIKAPGGTIGYVLSQYLVAGSMTPKTLAANTSVADKTVSRSGSDRTDSLIEAVVRVAMSFKGVRYVYGGASRKGTDCSGFVMQVYDSIGIGTPRSSISYGSAGVKIIRENLRVGDVVLFDTDGGRRINISHVGIYLGNDKFIHASSTNHQVVVASLSGYQAKYLGARRFLR